MSYNHAEIDKKWQDIWQAKGVFRAQEDGTRPKFYALDMFPYPSGAGLHIGHLASYTPNETVARYKRARGFNVLHPIGYDAFGLPAEQHAIQTGIHPEVTTQQAINNFRRQLQSFGYSFDWSREISTCDPSYYRWTQFIFLKLFEKGLAYQKEAPVNWCPALRTVLANEEVVDGVSERGKHPVVRVPMKQWMLKITAYAERLLNDLDLVDWPERTKEGQRNWIGRSLGAELRFPILHSPQQLEVFTTRPDTLFGVTFMVLAPEHPLVAELTTAEQQNAVREYQQASARKSEVERKTSTEKTGVFTGAYALHPLTQQRIPIWLSDYVLMGYGTGAIMAVPGHDTRDYEFATQFSLPIVRVLESHEDLPFEGEGRLVNSQFLDGLDKAAAIDKMIAVLEEKGWGKKSVQYKLRDWLFSRQRYWGEPFPLVEYSTGAIRAIPYNELPVILPEVADYQPSEQGEPPLARVEEWVTYTDPQTGEQGRRITDTMPGSAGSSWYFLRYVDPHNDREPFAFDKQKYWLPVDLYVGGPEHTVGHLLYSRFWHKVLFDAGLVSYPEPFQKLAHQGMILGSDGEKMSKSLGNTVNPDELREKYGADAVRMYISFLGPMDRDKPWAENGIEGIRRFLERVWRLVATEDSGGVESADGEPSLELQKLLHKTIKKVTEDIEALSFNTAISAMMILVNEIYKQGSRARQILRPLLQILAPFAPHLSEELWQRLGESELIILCPWPNFDPSFIAEDKVTVAVQVNGKMRGTVDLQKDADETTAVALAREITTVSNALVGLSVKKVIYVPGRILNLIAK